MNIVTEKRSGSKLFSLRGMSIRKQLPILICILLLSIIVLYGSIAYFGIKRTALSGGRDRLQSLTKELGALFQQNMQLLSTATQTAGNQPEIVQFVSGNKDSSARALEAIRKLQADTMNVLIELQDIQGKTILYTGKQLIQQKTSLNAASEIAAVKPLQNVAGKIYTIGDSMYIPSIATITKDKKPIGYIVRWRLLIATPQAVAQFSQLIGTKATIYFGNSDGSVWTDMMTPISKPPMDIKNIGKVVSLNEKGNNHVLASLAPLGGTKLLMLVELSEQTILEPANRFLYWVIGIGAILLTAGIIVAWLISRNIIRPIDQLMKATTIIANGNYDSRVITNRQDEFGKLASLFNTMATQVQNAKNDLEKKVQVRTKELIEKQQVEEMLKKSFDELRELASHLQDIREEERANMAREIHDELGQQLTGMKMDMTWLLKKISPTENNQVQEKLSSTIGLLDDTIKTVRKIATDLRPSILDDLGLLAAIEWHAQEFERRFGISTTFKSEVQRLDFSPRTAIGLFRICQESLTNIARYSSAKNVSIILQEESDQIALKISDDGIGFDPDKIRNKKTLGLLGMNERALMMGGEFEISSIEGKGTLVAVKVPTIAL